MSLRTLQDTEIRFSSDEIVAAQFGSRLALIAFATALMRGTIDRTDFVGAIQFAMIVLVVFFAIGLMIGEIGYRLAKECGEVEFQILRSEIIPDSTEATEKTSTE